MPETASPYDPWKNPIEELREFVDSLSKQEDMEDYCLKQLFHACKRVGLEDEFIACVLAGLDYGPALDSLRQAFHDRGIDDVDGYLENEFGLLNEKDTDW
jgi:hypothetical protein